MFQIRVTAFLLTLFTIALVVLFNTRLGVLPPMAKFLDPVAGVWQLTRVKDVPAGESIRLKGLEGAVDVFFNERAVPHIFAESETDLYRVTGYLIAHHRLWQMDIMARAFSGRLAEVLGPQLFTYDRQQRRLGATEMTQDMIGAMRNDPETWEALVAFSEGINAYIRQMPRRALPFEYRLLDHRPQFWSPERSAEIYLYVTQILTQRNLAAVQTELRDHLGVEVTELLYPAFSTLIDPIFPDFRSTNGNASVNTPGLPATTATQDTIPLFPGQTGVGSNNWAVSGERTASGAPLLASDPHLSLGLPSIWYELQLTTPNFTFYGVTIPGGMVPIIGFNATSAWGSTNLEAQATDLYRLEINEAGTHYFFEGEWVEFEIRQETVRVRGAADQQVQVYLTEHGPMTILPHERASGGDHRPGYAFRWTAQQAHNPFRAFWDLKFADTVEDFRESMSHLDASGLVTAFANNAGDIALQANGWYPQRPFGDGRYVKDGQFTDPVWDAAIPFDQLPHSINPPQGFVSSANQHPVGPESELNLGWYFSSGARAQLINENLSQGKAFTAEDMMAIQLDETNFWADLWLGSMLHALEKLDPPESPRARLLWRRGRELLQEWDGKNSADSLAPTLFTAWLAHLRRDLWKPLSAEDGKRVIPSPDWPSMHNFFFAEGAEERYAQHFGKPLDRSDLLASTFLEALNYLTENFGNLGPSWEWWRYNRVHLAHPTGIPALGTGPLQVGGSSESPNAASGNHGPSWRMVVELTDPVKAFGIKPGGQTSNPASPLAREGINKWQKGEYHKLTLYTDAETAGSAGHHQITFLP